MTDAERPSWEPESATDNQTTSNGARHGALQRLYLMFTSPSEVFADIDRKPTWVVVVILMALVVAGLQFVSIPHVDQEATIRDRAAARDVELSETQIERQVEIGNKFAKFVPVVTVVAYPLILAVMAAVLLVMLKLTGSPIDFNHTYSSMAHAMWPATLVSSALFAVIVHGAGKIPQEELQYILKSNLGAFMTGDTPPWLLSLGSSIDIFSAWIIILMVIGFAVVGKITRQRAAVAILVPWAIWVVGKVGLKALFS